MRRMTVLFVTCMIVLGWIILVPNFIVLSGCKLMLGPESVFLSLGLELRSTASPVCQTCYLIWMDTFDHRLSTINSVPFHHSIILGIKLVFFSQVLAFVPKITIVFDGP